MVREPIVAGQFYSGSAAALRKEIAGMIGSGAKKNINAIGAVSPHAGYAYSGPVACKVLSSIKPKKYFVILGTNHTGLGTVFGIDSNDFWRTPLGNVEIDRSVADKISKKCGFIKPDKLSHVNEHSIEVQLPFLQVLQEDFKIIPITISHADLNLYRKAGIGIAASIRELGIEDHTVIIASSDMTHYEDIDEAKKKDAIAISSMLALNEEELLRSVLEFDITMCGLAPVVVMIIAAKELGASRAELVEYRTSADASGDSSSVVGYAGLIIS